MPAAIVTGSVERAGRAGGARPGHRGVGGMPFVFVVGLVGAALIWMAVTGDGSAEARVIGGGVGVVLFILSSLVLEATRE